MINDIVVFLYCGLLVRFFKCLFNVWWFVSKVIVFVLLICLSFVWCVNSLVCCVLINENSLLIFCFNWCNLLLLW